MHKNNKNTQVNSDFLKAVSNGDLTSLVRATLDGADLNVFDSATGLQALHIAVGTNNLLMVRYLAEQCGVTFGPDRSGRWPSVIAAECKVDELVSDYIVEAEAAYLKKTGRLAPS